MTHEMVDALAVIGSAAQVRDRMQALADAGVGTFSLSPATPSAATALAGVRGVLV